MACPQRNGNTLLFTIQDNAKAAVIVCFTGVKRKQVNIQWGDGEGTVVEICDEGIVPGVSYTSEFYNDLKMDLHATVKVFYDPTTCVDAPTAWAPASNSSSLVQNCNPGYNALTVGAWLFQAPDGVETVQVTIVVEDGGWTGGDGRSGHNHRHEHGHKHEHKHDH